MFHGNFWANVEMDLKTGRFVEKESLLADQSELHRMADPEFMVEQLKKLTQPVRVIVICGKSEKLFENVTEAAGTDPRFKVLGYTNRMHALMRIADVFIGKPGGLTTSEALAVGVPMCIVTPIPGQEERNADHLLEEGIAVRCNDPVVLPYKIDKLLSDPQRLANMRENAKRLARPLAAETVVDTLIKDKLPPLSLSRAQRKSIAEAAG